VRGGQHPGLPPRRRPLPGRLVLRDGQHRLRTGERRPRQGHLCDATARFETSISAPSRPTWINYTGGDTLHSTAVTGSVVYIQGHQRWVDNPDGRDFAADGAQYRPGIAALDPSTGKAFAWNPTKTRGLGGKDLLAPSAGLWVASDGARFKGEYRDNIAFCPLP
jgi:hypothetical protein